MVVLAVVLAVLVAAGAFVAVQAKRYGGLRAAFSGELKEQRQALAAGRSAVNKLRKQRETELRDARRGAARRRAGPRRLRQAHLRPAAARGDAGQPRHGQEARWP